MLTRDEIRDAARAALNADPTRSLTEVAAVVGVGRATLHRHFATREALLHEIGSRSLDRWAETQELSAMTAATASADPALLAACLTAMLHDVVRGPEDYDFALTDPTLRTMPDLVERIEGLRAVEVAFLTAAQEAGVVRRDVPAAWLSHYLSGLLVAAREATLAGDVATRPLPDLFVTTFLTGASPR